ncbi:MAG: hypothetical protein HPY50_17180 [Firmicutes bacterium]|nr:hypothetical protein [Bacillota bacterium]
MKEDPVLKMQKMSGLDDEELLLMEAFSGGKSDDAFPSEPKEKTEDIPLDAALLKKGMIYDDDIVRDREQLLNRVAGKIFRARYRWFIWDDPNISEASVLEDCRALVEDHILLVYDGTGDLKLRLPLNRVMFRGFENLINVAWFDEEMDNIYYSIEMLVDVF